MIYQVVETDSRTTWKDVPPSWIHVSTRDKGWAEEKLDDIRCGIKAAGLSHCRHAFLVSYRDK